MSKCCQRCGREAYLWSAESCDVCDKDSDGIADALEGVSISGAPTHPTLFPVPEKGWRITSMRYETLIRPVDALMCVVKRLQAKLRPDNWHGLEVSGYRKVTAESEWWSKTRRRFTWHVPDVN